MQSVPKEIVDQTWPEFKQEQQRTLKDKIQNREEQIASFILECYCQFCDNKECNCYEIMERFQSNILTQEQISHINRFEIVNCACKNHVPNEGFYAFGHIIKVYFLNGRTDLKSGMYLANEISELWSEDVEYIEIRFTDVMDGDDDYDDTDIPF